jgi:hypothetical protein
MALAPEASVLGGLAVAGVVYSIHSNFTPTVADMQGLPSGNKDVDKSERQATWLSIGIVSGISLLAKDPTIFVIGSAATVAIAFLSRHATWTDTATGLVSPGPAQSAASANDLATGPQMSDTASYTMFSQSEFVSS